MVYDATSPFTPGAPVPLDFFVGRTDEVKHLENEITRTRSGQVSVAYLAGERGIGKSSLAAFARQLAERRHHMLGLHAFLGGVSSLSETTRRIFDALLKESADTGWIDTVKDLFGNYIKGVDIFGVNLSFEAPETELNQLSRNFVPAIERVLQKTNQRYNGIFLVLDDINGLAGSVEFANWLKSLVDEIATSRKAVPLCLLLVGLDEQRQALIEAQPSLSRVLAPIEVNPWSETETSDFFNRTFAQAGMTVEDPAMRSMVHFAGGLPMLGHEIGDAVFRIDEDRTVSPEDATAGVIAAADIVGRKHLQPKVLNEIRSQRYRKILETLGQGTHFRFQRKNILSTLDTDQQKVFDNFLQRMRKLGVIAPDAEGERGAYQYANQLHFLEAERARATP